MNKSNELKEWAKGKSGSTHVVITGAGYWGRGKSLVEATRNAMVDGEWVHANVYRIPNRLVKSISVGDRVEWEWSDYAMTLDDETQSLLSGMIKIGKDLQIRFKPRCGEVEIKHAP